MTAAIPNSHPTAAPPERQSAARGWQAPLKACAPGPMQTRLPPAVASGQPYRGTESVWLLRASTCCSARWAALGCDATSRHQSNAKGAEVCKPPRLSSRVIQTLHHQGVCFFSIVFRVVFVTVLSSPAEKRQRADKLGVGAFHSSQSYPATPSVEAFT